MKVRYFGCGILAITALAASSALLFPTFAQNAAPPPAPAGGGTGGGRGAAAAAMMAEKIKEASALPTPHTPDGHPDMTGFWGGGAGGGGGNAQGPAVTPDGRGIRPVAGAEEDEIAGDTAAVARRLADVSARPVYKPEFQAKAKEFFVKASHYDPSFRCTPLGVPRVGAPQEIAQIPNAVVLLYATRNTYRVIPTDGRPHDKDADTMPNGDGVGHWEGDTLVIDVTNIADDTWLDGDGSYHDRNMHVVERLTRQGNTLRYEVTVDDPTMFAQPFTPKPRTFLLGKADQHVGEDYPCLEQDQDHLTSDERH
jgi:hypothetical protein